jgi:hypothetical protein
MSGVIADTAVRLPAPVLSPFIAQYAGYRVSGLPSGVHVGLPSSGIDLFISLGHPIVVVKMPGSIQRPSVLTACVSGLQDGPAIVRQDSNAFGLHVFIKPLGVRAILGVASHEIASLVLNLSDLWGNRAEDLVHRSSTRSARSPKFFGLGKGWRRAMDLYRSRGSPRKLVMAGAISASVFGTPSVSRQKQPPEYSDLSTRAVLWLTSGLGWLTLRASAATTTRHISRANGMP